MQYHEEIKMRSAVLQIAREKLDVETLETRPRMKIGDSVLNILELNIWDIKAALEQAYKAGHAAGKK